MLGVIVSIQGTARSAQTDLDGYYEINDLADGTYTLDFNYVSYAKHAIKITLAGGATITRDVVMKAQGNQLSGTTVSSTRRTSTENAVVLEIKKSNVVVSGVSAAQISKTMDRNAADVVKRIPGVTIQDDRFITIRGLADRYNTVWLNDAGAPSAETDKKAFSFDIIPSGLIDRILIFKTPSPELPGDFAGGMVKIYTTSIPDKNTYTFGISTSYRSGSTGTDFVYNRKSSTDWLGYDDGSRSLPAGVTNDYLKTTDPNSNEISRSFGNKWQIFNKKTPMDLRVNGSASNIFKLGKLKLGSTVGFTYSSTHTNYNVNRLDYDDTNKQFNYNDLQSVSKVNLSGIANIAAVIGNSKIEFRNLYNQIGSAVVVSRTTNPDSFQARGADERGYAMGYESRATYSSQLSGTHRNESDTRKYTWTLGYTDVYKNQPDLRKINYALVDDGTNKYYSAQVSPGSPDANNGGGRYYAALFENVYSFSHQFTQKVKLSDKFSFDLNAGNYIEYKKRSFQARQFGYSLAFGPTTDSLKRLPINEIFADENVGGEGRYRISEVTSDYDKYSASNRLIASFLSVAVPVSSKIKVVTGVRYEDNLYRLEAVQNQVEVKPEVKTRFFLPSVNASYSFSNRSLIRAAYGKTINRPEFRETAPFFFYDFERRAGTYGAMYPTYIHPSGDTLDVAQIHNVDVRYEFYPSSGELIQIGGFYKQFKDPVQQVSYNNGNRAFTVINAQSAYCYGVEADLRKNLAFLDDRLNTKNIFGNFTLVSNLTLSKSQLTLGKIRDLPETAPFEGQSNYVINAGLFYQSDSAGIQASLLYNVYGPRLYSIGRVDDYNIGELSFHSLDFTLAKTIYKQVQLNVGVQNLLDQAYNFVLDGNRDNKFTSSDFRYSNYKPGRYFTLGLRMRF